MGGGTTNGGELLVDNNDLHVAKDLITRGLLLHPVTMAMVEIKSTEKGFRSAAHAVLDMVLDDLANNDTAVIAAAEAAARKEE